MIFKPCGNNGMNDRRGKYKKDGSIETNLFVFYSSEFIYLFYKIVKIFECDISVYKSTVVVSSYSFVCSHRNGISFVCSHRNGIKTNKSKSIRIDIEVNNTDNSVVLCEYIWDPIFMPRINARWC